MARLHYFDDFIRPVCDYIIISILILVYQVIVFKKDYHFWQYGRALLNCRVKTLPVHPFCI